MSIEKHPFQPFLPENAHILFLGSFPPQPHRWCMPFYYPNWINDFWRIMGLIHFGDKEHFCVPGEKRFDEAAIRMFCTDAGLAFYDTATEVRRLRDNASDAFLEVVTPTDIPALLARIPECRNLVTTGEKASTIISQTFGCPIPSVGSHVNLVIPSEPSVIPSVAKGPSLRAMALLGGKPITFWRMPSTSRAYPLKLEEKADAYRHLFINYQNGRSKP